MKRVRQSINLIVIQKTLVRKLFRKIKRGTVVYTAFPKSASHHFLNLVRLSYGKRLRIIIPKMSVGFGHNFISQDAILGDLTNFFRRLVLYGHFPYHYFNDLVIEGLGADTKIIVSVRPLPDVVVSYKEHVDNSNFGPLDYRINGVLECNPEWSKFDDKDKYDYIIKFIVPWYIRFAVGWLEGAKKWPLRIVTFEEQILYPYDFMMNISNFLQMTVSPAELKEKLNHENLSKLSYNVGIMGRGYKLLDQDQLDKIRDLVSCFGDSFLDSHMGRYLLHGFDGLSFEVTDVISGNSQGTSLDPFCYNHIIRAGK